MNPHDSERLQSLLRAFHTLTGMKICLYDSSEHELCYYPEQFTGFCRLLRENPETGARCEQCDRMGFAECKRTQTQSICTCHAGLIECFSPILYDSGIIGYIAIGQIRANTEWVNVRSRLPGIPEETLSVLEERFERLPRFDSRLINAAIRVLGACAGYELLKNFIRDGENRIDAALGAYVNNHLTDTLSVTGLCSRFRLSRTELYRIFREYFGTSPAEFIKTRRLSYACELLRTSEEPITRIAELCGIPDYNYFAKMFRKTYGISPCEYRRMPESIHPVS